jgi:(R,R)-butanediol dehydrogenase / meso-butanediol dehydrogenase / diacetyl reductase
VKAAQWYGREDIRIEEVPEPTPKQGEIKIAVEYCGICGTDVGEYLHGPVLIKNPPVILGHEYSGKVVGIGAGVQGFKIGDRVTALNNRSCGTCPSCKVKDSLAPGKKMELCPNMDTTGLSSSGAFAEFICIPAYLATKLGDNLSWEEGTMINPLSIGIHGLKRGSVRVGENVLVVGDGTIGQLALQACLAAGVQTAFLVGEQPMRMQVAKQCGAREVFHYKTENLKEKIMECLGGRLPEVTFDCVGNEAALRTAVNLVAKGGRALLIGIYEVPCQINFKDVVIQEKDLRGVLSQDYEDYDIGNALISQGKIKSEPLITKRIPLKDLVNGGIKELIENRQKHIRILVSPKPE